MFNTIYTYMGTVRGQLTKRERGRKRADESRRERNRAEECGKEWKRVEKRGREQNRAEECGEGAEERAEGESVYV